MCTVLNVAKYIQKYCVDNGIKDCSNKKLQKLLYYVQAWSCALRGNIPVFEAQIEAWLHGPVVPEIYRKYKQYGYLQIPFDSHGLNMEALEEHKLIIDSVLRVYAKYDADFLEMRTHIENPWIEARRTDDKIISLESMGNFYRKMSDGAKK